MDKKERNKLSDEGLEKLERAVTAEAVNIEALAEYAHDAWSGWMDYLFQVSSKNENGTATMPKWAVDRWKRQAATKYKDLSEDEKGSDRAEAVKMLDTLNKGENNG